MRLWAEISRKALAGNLRIIRERIPRGTAVMLVVKADAYGHGLEVIVNAARDMVEWFGVTNAEEAARVLNEGGSKVLAFFEPESVEEADFMIRNNVSFNVFRPDTLKMVAEAARKAGKQARVHIKINTGMNRLGVKPGRFTELYEQAAGMDEIAVEGVWTHLATADHPDDPFANEQINLFNSLTGMLKGNHVRHAANSGGTLFYPGAAFDMVRVGIAGYGYLPDPEMKDEFGFEPVLTLKAAVLAVQELKAGEGVSYGLRWRASRPTRIGIVSAGYADGIMRTLSGSLEVLYENKRYPSVGVICMDQFAVDFGQTPVMPGDEVVIIGKNIPASELARKAGTISYEVLSRIGSRVKRMLVD